MPYFKYAKSNCCNFGNGPNKKANFCWLEPGGDNLCLLYHDGNATCDWFIHAVLLSNKDLKRQWQDSQISSIDNRKRCDCGKKFFPTSNRQIRCEKCAEKTGKEASILRVRKHRASKGSDETL